MKQSSRLQWQRILLFFLVVWTIGGAFLLLESGYTRLLALGLRLLPGSLVEHHQSREAREHCDQVIRSSRRQGHPPILSSHTKYAVWQLGFQFGWLNALLNVDMAPPELRKQTLANLEARSLSLGVPPPVVPERVRTAYGLRDFGVALTEDPQCVCAALEDQYSPRHADLFRFASVTAMALFYRREPAAGIPMDTEIQLYGTAAGISPELWRPLLEPLPAGIATQDSLQAIFSRLDNGMKSLD